MDHPPFTPEPAKAPGGEETAGVGVGAGEPGATGEAGASTPTGETSGTATVTKPGGKGTVRRFVVRGNVPVENWGELFRCFVGPAVRMNLKKLGLGVQFELVLPEDRRLSENDPALKAMKEAARQLGLTFQIEERCSWFVERLPQPVAGRRTMLTTEEETMAQDRTFDLSIAQTVIALPCFFPSVSSVKTNLMPVDYVELLDAATHPLWLASAYDIATCQPEQRSRMNAALIRSKKRGAAILMDSGNYEAFWKGELAWKPDRFHEVAKESEHHLCFCHDNQDPPDTAEAIAEDVVSSVLRDQQYALGTVAPIIHGPTELLPTAARIVAEQLFPVLLAVPERALGEGIIARTQAVRRIRKALDGLGIYCPLHLLGTGNPLSIAAYAMAGADSFGGLEWCQTVVDHETRRLFHFQQWDLFKDQTDWGSNGALPYIQSALMHNLEFYRAFMSELREALINDAAEAFLRRHATDKQASLLMGAIKGGN